MKNHLLLLLAAYLLLSPWSTLNAQDENCEFNCGTFETLEALPVPLWKGFSCVIENKIYVTGGFYFLGAQDEIIVYSDSLYIFDPATGSWDNTRTPIPVARGGIVGSCVIDGKWYIPGGISRHYIDPTNPNLGNYAVNYSRLDVYDPVTDSWELKQSLPEALGMIGVAALGGKVYVTGGMNNDNQIIKSVYEYDPTTDNWTQKTDMGTARASHACVALDGKLYSIGGRPATSGSNNLSAEFYDPLTDDWTPIASPLLALLDAYPCIIDQEIYLTGGTTGNYNPYSAIANISKYSPETDTWAYIGQMPEKRVGHNTEAIDRTVYLIGGQEPYDIILNDVTALKLSDINLGTPIPNDTIDGDSIQIDLLQHFSHLEGESITFSACVEREKVSASIEGSMLTMKGLSTGVEKVRILAESGEDQGGSLFKMYVLEPTPVVGIPGKDGSSPTLEVYPNPAKDMITIQIQKEENHDYMIYSVTGQLLLEGKIEGSAANVIDVSMLRKGMYLLKVGSRELTLTRKIIKL